MNCRSSAALSEDTIRLLEALGHKIVVRGAWGSAQSIMRMNGQLMGASDTRQRGTLAIGYDLPQEVKKRPALDAGHFTFS